MFPELTDPTGNKGGWIEVICGSMFSGKTEELIRRLRRAQIARQRVEIFKPEIDNRYHEKKVVSHDANELHSNPVRDADAILSTLDLKEVNVIGIDEAQFFDAKLVGVCNRLANMGKRVVVAGLDMDYTGSPFGPIPGLLAIAEYVTKVHAICLRCGSPANYSHRLAKGDELVLLGEKTHYEPLCRKCFTSDPGPH